MTGPDDERLADVEAYLDRVRSGLRAAGKADDLN